MKRLAIAALSALLFVPAASAQDGSLLGRWGFRTAPHPNSGCVISGTADVTPTRGRTTLGVSIRAVETCGEGDEGVTALEACVATISSDASPTLAILCTLQSSTSDTYAPDNFYLRRTSRDVMDGRLDDDRAWDVPVRFERNGDGALVS